MRKASGKRQIIHCQLVWNNAHSRCNPYRSGYTVTMTMTIIYNAEKTRGICMNSCHNPSSFYLSGEESLSLDVSILSRSSPSEDQNWPSSSNLLLLWSLIQKRCFMSPDAILSSRIYLAGLARRWFWAWWTEWKNMICLHDASGEWSFYHEIASTLALWRGEIGTLRLFLDLSFSIYDIRSYFFKASHLQTIGLSFFCVSSICHISPYHDVLHRKQASTIPCHWRTCDKTANYLHRSESCPALGIFPYHSNMHQLHVEPRGASFQTTRYCGCCLCDGERIRSPSLV